MSFCQKCGSILVPKKENDRILFVCLNCGYKETPKKVTEKIENKKDVDVVEKDFEHLPEEKIKCPKCEHDTALFWTKQTRAADEAETTFYKCKKCGHTWRDYG